jgi:hypothetical protein
VAAAGTFAPLSLGSVSAIMLCIRPTAIVTTLALALELGVLAVGAASRCGRWKGGGQAAFWLEPSCRRLGYYALSVT